MKYRVSVAFLVLFTFCTCFLASCAEQEVNLPEIIAKYKYDILSYLDDEGDLKEFFSENANKYKEFMIDYLADEGYLEDYFFGGNSFEYKDRMLEFLYDEGYLEDYLREHLGLVVRITEEIENYPDLLMLVDEAEGHETSVKMLFDFAEEVGYGPSKVFGPYCYDNSTHTIHSTDSECVERIPYQKRYSFWGHYCFSLNDVEYVIENNSYLSKFEWTFCSKCIASQYHP